MALLKPKLLCRPLYITSRHYCDNNKTLYQIEEEGKKVRTSYGKAYPEWRNQWLQRKGEWSSKLSVFVEKSPSANILNAMQKIPELNFQIIREWWAHMKVVQERNNQKYLIRRVELLGANLAAMHYFTFRGAALRLTNSANWISGKNKSMELPAKFEEGYFVEAIDCSDFQKDKGGMRYEGCENLIELNFLKWLSLKNNPHIDEWCLDRIAGQNGKSLEYLDISGCKLNVNCINAIARMRALKMLVITDPGDNAEFQTALSILEEEKTGLLIKTVDDDVALQQQN